MPHRPIAVLPALMLALAPLPAAAQTAPAPTPGPATPGNQMVVTATRIPSPADTLPAGVTVIDRQTMAHRGDTTLADALAVVPGAHLVQLGGPGSVGSLFLRGTNSNQVAVLLDGMPINDPASPSGAFDFGQDLLDDLSRIEVVRGPMSGLYGSGAIGGVVNLITAQGHGAPHGSVRLSAGLPRSLDAAATLSGASGKFDYALSAEGTDSVGFDVTPRRESVYTGERDGDRAHAVTINLGATIAPHTRISLLARGLRNVSGYDNVGGVQAFDGPNMTASNSSAFGRLGLTTQLLDGAWHSAFYVALLQSDRRYSVLFNPADPNQESDDSRYHGRRATLQWNNILHLADAGMLRESTLTFGYQHVTDQAVSRVDSVSFGSPYLSDVRASDTDDAATLGAQTLLAQRLTLSAQTRAEATSQAGNAATWRLGAVLALPEIASHLHAAYGTSFRAPSLFERYGVDNYGFVGNAALKPERSIGWEVGWRIDAALLGRSDFASLEVTYFANRLHDLIETQFSPTYTTVNIGRATTQGVESVLTLRPRDWISLDASWTYTDTRDTTTGAALLRRPRNTAALDADIRPWHRLRIVPELIYASAFMDYITDNQGYSAGIGRSPAGLIANLAVTYDLTDHVTLFVRVRNLGNAQYEPANGYAAPGTSGIIGTRVTF